MLSVGEVFSQLKTFNKFNLCNESARCWFDTTYTWEWNSTSYLIFLLVPRFSGESKLVSIVFDIQHSS